MIAFIDDHRATGEVEPICRLLPIASSTYFERVAQRQDLMRLSARAQRDQALNPEIARVFAENFGVYGVRKVWRQFRAPAPNRLWVSDFTYVATWAGFVYVAFAIDTNARRIVGWRASRSAHASFVLDGLEQALHDCRPAHRGGLVHHSDRGSQYVSIKYTERLAEAVIESSVGSVGDNYDNALAETINGLYKAEVIHRRAPWRSFEAVEYACSSG
jgi:putative transposase